jgi:uncharacterized RDD family membrane protein YckC
MSSASAPLDEWVAPIAPSIAGLGQRIGAAIIDWFVLGSAFVVAFLAPLWFSLPLLLLVVIGNEIVGVALWGQSVGKALVGIRVVKAADAMVPRFGTALLRSFIQNIQFGVMYHPFATSSFAVMIGPWPLICYGPILYDRVLRRGLHDRVAGTVVVRVEPSAAP